MDFGGEMRFSFGGNLLKLRGDFKLSPSNVKSESIVNQDNSVSTKYEPKGYDAEMKFEDTPVGQPTALDWNGIIRGGPYNITLTKNQTGTLHTWTGAKIVGDAMVDRMNGEVTGLKVKAQTYKKTAA